MNKQIALALGVIVTGILLVVVWQFFASDSASSPAAENAQMVPVDDPIDVTLELYDPWLAGLLSTTTEFNKEELLNAAPLTSELRATLLERIAQTDVAVDPIICQANLPERIGAKSIFTNDTEAQVIVVARGQKVPEQALVTLQAIDGKWVLSDVFCSQGEVAPEREFTFEQAGNILKQSLQPPLDPAQWHLIYTKDTVAGYAIPLLFTAESMCIATDGVEQVCNPDQLAEATAVFIQGEMQEAGVRVQRMSLQ